MSELVAINFELRLFYGLTEDGLIESSLRATDKDAHTLYAESYSSQQITEGYFQSSIAWPPRLKAAFQDQVLTAAKIFQQVATKQAPLFFAALVSPPPKFWLRLAFKGDCKLSERDPLRTTQAALVLLNPLGNLVWNEVDGQIVVHQTPAFNFDKLDDQDWSSTLAVWAAMRVNFIATIFEALGVKEN